MKTKDKYYRKTNLDAWIDVSNLPRLKRGIDWSSSVGCKIKFQYNSIHGEFVLKKYEKDKHFITIQYNDLPEFSLHTSSFENCDFLNYITPKNDIVKRSNDIWIDISTLPRIYGNLINWNNCIGKICNFQYKTIIGNLEICDYIHDKNNILIKYLNNPLYEIKTSTFLHCGLKNFLQYKEIEFLYNSEEEIHNEKINCIILDKRIVKYDRKDKNNKVYHCNEKQYKIGCLDCGYGINQDWWVAERKIKEINSGCPCCANLITVEGINDIPTTDPWMIPYFQGGYDEAKMYTSGSNLKIYPKCPDCGRVDNKLHIIQKIKNYHSINCSCSDKLSYPNKFSYALLDQLPVSNVKHEWTPDWIAPKRYDNYFEYQNQKYILELDGLLGHGKRSFKSTTSKEESLFIDHYKDEMAIKHGIIPIRIDCQYETVNNRFEYVKNSILNNSQLNHLFNLKDIDWERCNEFALTNRIKEICQYWESSNAYHETMCDKFSICYTTLQHYLKEGAKHGWCSYNKNTNRLKGIATNNRKYNQRYIRVYDEKLNFIMEYDGINKFYKNSKNLIGVSVTTKYIIKCCKRERDFYKGYTFRYSDDDELYENNKKYEETA